MTNSKKNALIQAFSIPEPQRKRRFIAEYKVLEKNKKTAAPIVPRLMKTLTTAAMCVLVVGAWMGIKENTNVTPDMGHDLYVSVDEQKESNDDTLATTKTTNADVIITKTTVSNKAKDKSDSVTSTNTTLSSVEGTSKNATEEKKEKTTQKTQEKTSASTASSAEKTESTSAATTVTEKGEEPITTEPPVNDMTVDFGVRYTVNGNIVSIDDMFQKDNAPSGNEKPVDAGGLAPTQSNEPPSIINLSDEVFIGYIEDIIYTSRDNSPYTQLNIRVQESIKGDLNTNDIISLFYSGGFIPARQFAEQNGIQKDFPDDMMVRINDGNYLTPNNNSTYLFFAEKAWNIGQVQTYFVTQTSDNSILNINGNDCTSLDSTFSCNLDEIR